MYGIYGPHIDLGGVALQSAPAAVDFTTKKIVLYRGPNGNLWWSDWTSPSIWWGAPIDLGIPIASAPALAQGLESFDLFYRDHAGHLWTTTWTDGRWDGNRSSPHPTDLGALDLDSAPAAV